MQEEFYFVSLFNYRVLTRTNTLFNTKYMAKKKIKKSISKNKSSSDALFVKHPNLQWLLPLLAVAAIATYLLQISSS